MDRRDRIMEGLRLGGLGLEIGGGYNPLVAGTPGLNVRTLDHLTTEKLIEKYARMGVDVSRVQPVDYPWSGERYRDLVGETRFDWIVASHVIEHVPDLVGFVNQCAEILTDDGVLTLAVPDHRYCFDHYRPPSGLGELIDAHLQQRTTSTSGAVAAHFLHLSELDGQGTWDAASGGAPTLSIPADLAAQEYSRSLDGRYIDVHAWTFTPATFRLAVDNLSRLGLLQLREKRSHGTEGCEFFVQLSRDGVGAGDRQALAEAVAAERRGDGAAAMSAERDQLARELSETRAALAAIQASTSWRMTAPIRAGKSLLGRRKG